MLQHFKCSDWFVIYQLFSNCHDYTAKQILKCLQKYFSSQSRHKSRTFPKLPDENRKRKDFLYADDEDIYAKPPV